MGYKEYEHELEEYFVSRNAKIIQTKHICNINQDPTENAMELAQMLQKFGKKYVHVPNARIKTGKTVLIGGYTPTKEKCQPSTYSICANIDETIINAANKADSFDYAIEFTGTI